MERWKKNDPSLRIGDSEEDAIIVSDTGGKGTWNQ